MNIQNIFIMSPLDQFEIIILRPITIGSLDFSFTNLSLYGFIVAFVFYFFTRFLNKSPLIVLNTFWQLLVETLYKFVYSIVKQQVGTRGQSFFVLIFALFSFILTSNLVGMIPYSFTITSHISVTFFFAWSLFLTMIVLGFLYQRWQFLLIFVPGGLPPFLVPILAVLEVLSFFSKPVSLSVRLFANLMSGHTLLNILSSFIVKLFNKNFFFALFPLLITIAVVVLELGVAVVQAYVFTMLFCLYLNDSINVKTH